MHSLITTTHKKKIISFSLWGNDRKYTYGAIKNAELADKIYSGWIVRYYCSKSVPTDIVSHLAQFKNSEIIFKNETGDWAGLFWRFYPASDRSVEIMISRDCDSRLNLRERTAVDEWINSENSFHIMRDHPDHNFKILGGMWGVKNPKLHDMQKMIHEYLKGNISRGTDQTFLGDVIYPLIKNDCLAHDEIFDYEPNSRAFPFRRKKIEFVGEIFDCNDNPSAFHRDKLGEYLKKGEIFDCNDNVNAFHRNGLREYSISRKFYIRIIHKILKFYFREDNNKPK